MKLYEFTHNIQGREAKVTVRVHNVFIACFNAYCEAIYDEEKLGRGFINAKSPEENRPVYEKMFKERGRWAWFQRGTDGCPILHLCIDENEHKGGSLCDIMHSLAHELDHFWKGGFFTAAEAEASAVFTGHMAQNALDMTLSIITDRYARPQVAEVFAGDHDQMMTSMDAIFECMAFTHKVGQGSVESGEWTQDALDERMYALAVAMIHAREQKRAAEV